MKKKFMPILLAMATMVATGLTGCDNNNSTTSTKPSTEPTPSTSPSTKPSTSLPTVIHVDSVAIAAEKETLFVGEETKVTVTVLPETASDKTYTLKSSKEAVATVDSTGKVVAVGAGETTITVTSTDGNKTGTVKITVKAVTGPKLEMPQVLEYNVNAGENLTLPEVKAKNYKGEDVTSTIEIADSFESKTINKNVFNAKIAGKHQISYYVEDDNGEDEQFITVNVKAATEESFDVGNNTDPAAIKNYGVYKENFANGRKNKLGINDKESASYISATSEAISGNSLIIDTHKTAGHALNQVFMMGFNDNFIRGVSATYKVSFDYKILSNAGNLGDFYLQLGWDNFDGINRNFVNTSAAVGSVQHYEVEFAGSIVPATGNAWFSFWKLGGKEARIAIDNLVFESKREVQTTVVTPTSDQLLAEGGFTWNMADKGCTISSGKAVAVDDVTNESVRTTMKNSSHFGDVAMELTGADGHLFSGLTKDNMVAGKEITISVTYAAINGSGMHLIMMGAGSNPTLTNKVTNNEDGTYTISWTGTVLDGWYQLNIYGANNPKFDIFIGEIKVSLKEAAAPDPDKTPNGYEVGFKFVVTDPFIDGNTKKVKFDGNADVAAVEAMGTAPYKLSFATVNSNEIWFRAGGKIENGMTYRITCNYYITESNNQRLMYNIDNADFKEIGPSTVGYHQNAIEWKMPKDVDFFSIFTPGESGFVGTVYINTITVELIGIN